MWTDEDSRVDKIISQIDGSIGSLADRLSYTHACIIDSSLQTPADERQ